MKKLAFYAAACLFAACFTGAQAQVIRLPYNSIQEYLNNEPLLSLTLQLASPSYEMLARTDTVATVFLPTSDAITMYLHEQYGVEDLAELWSNPSLNKLLLSTFNSVLLPHHLVPQRNLTSSQLLSGMQLATALGRPLTVVRSGGSISVQGQSNTANIVKANQMLANGLVMCHLIDAVLLADPLGPPPLALLTSPSPTRRPPPSRASPPPPSPPSPPPSPPPPARRQSPPPTPPPPTSPQPPPASPPPRPPARRSSPPPSPAPPPPPPPPPPLSPPPPPPLSPRRQPLPPPSRARPPPPQPVTPTPPPPLRPRPRPPPLYSSTGLNLAAELRGLGALAQELMDLLAQGPQLADVLPVLARLSPHAAGHLSRGNATLLTFFLPSPEAFASYLDSAGNLDSLDLPALIAFYRRTLTVIAYHGVPGGSSRRTLSAAALAAATTGTEGGVAALTSLVPDAALGVMLLSGQLQVLGADGGIGAVVRTDLALGQRLVVHVIDKLVGPPVGSEMPLNGAKPQARQYPSLLAWMADPTNLDAAVYRVLRGVLPPNFLAALDNANLMATLFMPVDSSLLGSPEVLQALSAPPAAATGMLATLLKGYILPDEALARTDLQLIHYGISRDSAAGTPLLFNHGDSIVDGQRISITLVNGIPIRYYDRPAGKTFVQILSRPLKVDFGYGGLTLLAPPLPPSPSWLPPPPPPSRPPRLPPSPPPPPPVLSPRRQPPPPMPRPSPNPSPRPSLPPPPAPPLLPFSSLAAAIEGLPELSSLATLYDIAIRSALFNTIMDSVLLSPFTMFLPNDQAVDSYLETWEPGRSLKDLEGVVRTDARALVRLLSPHTLLGRRLLATSFPNATTLTTGIAGAAGARLRVSQVAAPPVSQQSGSQVQVQVVNLCCGVVARVLRPDVLLSGGKQQGVIHVIDTFITTS